MTLWSASVGFLPHKVTAREEPSRGNTVYLWWRADGNWRKRSLRRGVRTARGRVDPELARWARAQAEALYAQLVQGVPAAELLPEAPLTVGATRAALTDPRKGKHRTDTPHRREVLRELERAVHAWGSETTWTQIKRADYRALWRTRIDALRDAGRVGLRGAEVTVQRVLAIAQWLRDEELIPQGAAVAPRTWRVELKADWLEVTGERGVPEPERPRYTMAESRAILAHAHTIDPRYALLLALGAELRPGQVVRARRSDLDLVRSTFTVYGRGHKRGEVVGLTDGQVRAAREAIETGYLRELEHHAADYPLFPAGQLPGARRQRWRDPKAGARTSRGPTVPTATLARHAKAAPVAMSAVRNWHRRGELAAGIERKSGRGPYGLRRAAVDEAKRLHISREGLKALGGWSDTQVPDRIYADQEMRYARDEAKAVRARLRGEE